MATKIRDRLLMGSPLWKAMVTRMDALITLVNELKADYNAHRVLTAGSVHGAADSTNVVASSDVSTLDQE